MIQLGMTARDRITGFSGVVTGYVQYLTGCNQALLNPPVKPDGSLNSSEWVDVQRLERVGDDLVQLDNGPNPGSDRAAPRR